MIAMQHDPSLVPIDLDADEDGEEFSDEEEEYTEFVLKQVCLYVFTKYIRHYIFPHQKDEIQGGPNQHKPP